MSHLRIEYTYISFHFFSFFFLLLFQLFRISVCACLNEKREREKKNGFNVRCSVRRSINCCSLNNMSILQLLLGRRTLSVVCTRQKSKKNIYVCIWNSERQNDRMSEHLMPSIQRKRYTFRMCVFHMAFKLNQLKFHWIFARTILCTFAINNNNARLNLALIDRQSSIATV